MPDSTHARMRVRTQRLPRGQRLDSNRSSTALVAVTEHSGAAPARNRRGIPSGLLASECHKGYLAPSRWMGEHP